MWTVCNIAAVIWIESGDTAFCIRKPYVGQSLACGGPRSAEHAEHALIGLCIDKSIK